MRRPMPQPQDFRASRFGVQQERFVKGQVLPQAGEREVEVVHAQKIWHWVRSAG